MQLTPQAQAILLLTVNFGKADKAGAKPLSNSEWGRFAAWLRDHDLTPADLLSGNDQILAQLIDRTLTHQRIQALLDRGAAVGFALEKWERAGLWVLTRADQEYPERLKRRLRTASPPVFFGCGNKALLGKGGLAVVGSRNASDANLAFTAHLGKQTASQGLSIISGGARGVDDAAITGALENEGTGVAVLADSLLRTATASRFRRPLIAGDLVLISPFNPEAGFLRGNAMARNKYIYCLADAAVVVSSTPGKGGTWAGAIEAIRHDWVPVWIKNTSEAGSGNPRLVEQGARWLPDDVEAIASLSTTPERPAAGLQLEAAHHGGRPAHLDASNCSENSVQPSRPDQTVTVTNPGSSDDGSAELYEAFLAALTAFQDHLPSGAEAISAHLGMKKAEVSRLLKKAVERGVIEKLSKPVRFRFAAVQARQPSLFDNDL